MIPPEVTRSICRRDLRDYTTLSQHAISGDLVPEPLIGALFSYLLGVQLPGNGANYLKQETRFHGVSPCGRRINGQGRSHANPAGKTSRGFVDDVYRLQWTTDRQRTGAGFRARRYCQAECKMTEPLVTLDVTGNAAVIRLNRPSRHNALVPELLDRLARCAGRCTQPQRQDGDSRGRGPLVFNRRRPARILATPGQHRGLRTAVGGSAKPGRAFHYTRTPHPSSAPFRVRSPVAHWVFYWQLTESS